MKSKGMTELLRILIIIDDFSDEPAFIVVSQNYYILYTPGADIIL